MNDINVIFKDIAVMIHDQGDTVNSIEANIETTQSRIQMANENLGTALKNQVILKREIISKTQIKQTTFFKLFTFFLE